MGRPIPPGGAYAKWILVVLLLVYVHNQWSRFLINYLYAVSDSSPFTSISVACSLTTSEYGLLVGFGFSAFFVVMGLFAGRAADRYSRQRIIGCGISIWSLAVLYMGTASSFWQLLVSRVVLGFGESFSAPASYSMIADLFPIDQRGTANGVFAFGVYVGGGLGSLSIAMATALGWRGTCYSAGAAGLLLALLMFVTVSEPQRGGKDAGAKVPGGADQSVWAALGEVYRSPLLVKLYMAGGARFSAGYLIAAYMPLYYAYVFPEFNSTYSLLNASVVSIGGAVASAAGGYAVDKWEKAGNGRARLLIPMLGCIATMPFMAVTLLSNSFYVSMLVGLLGSYLCAEGWFSGALSVIQGTLSPRARALGISIFIFIATMAGSLATYAIGIVVQRTTDNGVDNLDSIRYIILVSVCTAYALSAFIFWLASRHMPARTGDVVLTDEEAQPLVKGTPAELPGAATEQEA